MTENVNGENRFHEEIEKSIREMGRDISIAILLGACVIGGCNLVGRCYSARNVTGKMEVTWQYNLPIKVSGDVNISGQYSQPIKLRQED